MRFVRMMAAGLITGLVLGAGGGTAIFFLSPEPLTARIIWAEAITGIITGLLVTRLVHERRGWVLTLFAGGLLGFLVAAPLVMEVKMGVPYIPETGVLVGVAAAAILKGVASREKQQAQTVTQRSG